MSNRSYIRNTILLCTDGDQEKQKRRFTVKDSLSAGSDAVCYTAKHNSSGYGVLKEFYPLDVHTLRRREDGQLISEADTPAEAQRYQEKTEAFLEPYKMLLEMRKDSDLATFIPPFEICCGCDENGERIGTVYIWSPEPAHETFEALCAEIHAHPAVTPEYNLVRVLYSIESLVKCTRILHSAGLLHRDIKPSNFGFVLRGKELLTQSISLFDVDTICSVYNVRAGEIRGTKGYLEPEARCGSKPTNQTDIYAIGATLFYAVIDTERTRSTGYRYQESLYQDLKLLVDESALLLASDANSHPHLRSMLTRILQKSLAPREERYTSCEELLADVQKALYYVVPAELAERGNAGEQWVLADLKKLSVLKPEHEKSAALALQHHLYEYPLYTDAPDEKQTLDVLLIGCGKYGEMFLDLALQIAQMPGKQLRITVVSASAEDKACFLADRPELSKFFGIDGSLQNDPGRYGDIHFIVKELPEDDAEASRRFLESLSEDSAAFDCAFIAAGRNARNLAFARAAAPLCRTSFVWEGKALPKKEVQSLLPVYINESISAKPFFTELERMAFNVHLIWNKNLNIDFSEVRKEFKKPYNHNSCVSFVLAVKYKLHAIGIEIGADSFDQTAAAYCSYLSRHKAERDMLVYYEHRRWVTEKLCLGYTAITDLNECAGGMTKDEKRRRHICIVRSTPQHTLAMPGWRKDGFVNKQRWDHPSDQELAALDPLDRVSVELHLVHLRQAKPEMINSLLSGEIAAAISNHIEPDPGCAAAFQELITCMESIRLGDSEQCQRYEGLRQTFQSQVRESERIPERDRKSVRRLTDSMNEKFYPILASQQFRDYKQDDEALVDGIPFILTYSDALYMVIPFSTGNNTQQFGNLAAPTVVNPAKILYLAYCTTLADFSEIRKTLPYLSSYMKKKKLRAGVEFIIGYEPNAARVDSVTVTDDFRAVSGGRVIKVKLIAVDEKNAFCTALRDYLLERQQGKPRLLLEKNKTPLSNFMEDTEFFETFSRYGYDSARKKFYAMRNCEVLRHIRMEPFITAADMFAFKMSARDSSNKPEFYTDFKDLWDKYRQETEQWKYLCSLLREYAAEHDLITVIGRNGTHAASETVYQYIVPVACRKSIRAILQALIAEKIISPSSGIKCVTSHTCAVTIRDLCRSRAAYDKLFSRIDLLMQPDFVRCDTDSKSHTVKISYNRLVVTNLDCKSLTDSGYALLDYFSTKHYLISLSYDKTKKHAGFTFATPQIKDLLTVESRMLEVYTYHMAKEAGVFDDIRSSFEIDWEKSLAPNVFDCVLTKDFSVLFVKCLTAKDIRTESYTGISRLAEEFGINAKAVLIADTQDTDDIAALHAARRAHGEQLDVITVSDRDDITNIGAKLYELISR